MPLFLQYLYVIGSFQGFLLSALLLFSANVSQASRVLGIWCLFLAIGLLTVLVIQGEEMDAYTMLLGMTGFFPASYGALLYLYCRHSVLDEGFQLRDLLHFIPFASCYILNADLFFAQELLEQLYSTGSEGMSSRYTLASIILYGQAFVYMGLTANFLFSYQRRAQDNYANFNPDIFDWLWIVQGFNLIIWSIKTATAVLSYNLVLLVAGDLLIVLLIYGIGMAQWRNPQLFKIAVPVQGQSNAKSERAEQKASGALDEDTRANLLETVIQHMKEEQAYLDPDLSLRSLSEAVGISPHHLSEILNQAQGQNFYNFVNALRIDYVCQRLKLDADVKVLDLGLMSGFSSKSTFNSVFKKHTGLTPSQYRRQHRP